jgi:hypothetical protein
LRWPKISEPQFEVIGSSLDRDKREMLEFNCRDTDCNIEDIPLLAEACYPWKPRFVALRTFWREQIIPHWKGCKQEPF